MTTKEIKEQVLAKLQRNVESVKQLLVEDKESNFNDRYARGLLAGYYEAMALIEDIPVEGCTPLKLEVGQRYKCLASHYDNQDNPDNYDNADLLRRKLSDTILSIRAVNALHSHSVDRVADLVTIDKKDLLRMRNFGRKTLRDVEDFLDANQLAFGMNIPHDFLSDNFKHQWLTERRY